MLIVKDLLQQIEISLLATASQTKELLAIKAKLLEIQNNEQPNQEDSFKEEWGYAEPTVRVGITREEWGGMARGPKEGLFLIAKANPKKTFFVEELYNVFKNFQGTRIYSTRYNIKTALGTSAIVHLIDPSSPVSLECAWKKTGIDMYTSRA